MSSGSGGSGTGGRAVDGATGGSPGLGTGGVSATGGSGTGGASESGGATGSGGGVAPGSGGGSPVSTGGLSGTVGTGGTATTSSGGKGGGAVANPGTGGGATVPSNCNLPTPVGFVKDVQPILTASCGKNTSSGCHVVDGSSTAGSLCPDGTKTCGGTHAYDWITAGSHASSCPETPNPKRFEVVIAVIDQANPPSCSKSRKMPPPGMGTALTACQIATIQAWLDEPKVTQLHRTDDSSPTTPYAMPPLN